jgi:hypothetical protein
MRSKVGPITNRVRNSDRPMITWLGGDACVPRAMRSSDSTITMRVNEVIISSIAGRKLISVRNSSVCTGTEYWVPPPAIGAELICSGACCASAGAAQAARTSSTRISSRRGVMAPA